MSRFGFAHNRLGVAANQLLARHEHARGYQIETGARNQPGNDPAGARFAHRVRRNDGVREFVDLHVLPAAYDKPRFMQKTVAAKGRRTYLTAVRIATHFPRWRT